jgi:hypothetical protein
MQTPDSMLFFLPAAELDAVWQWGQRNLAFLPSVSPPPILAAIVDFCTTCSKIVSCIFLPAKIPMLRCFCHCTLEVATLSVENVAHNLSAQDDANSSENPNVATSFLFLFCFKYQQSSFVVQ